MKSNRATFDLELDKLNARIVELGDMVERALDQSMIALLQQDVELANKVIRNDEGINQLRYGVNEMVTRIIAMQQPMASDLRRVLSAMTIAVELERMGDHAKYMAEEVEPLVQSQFNENLQPLPELSSHLRQLLRQVVQAYVNHDGDQIDTVIADDIVVNARFSQITQKLMKDIQSPDKDPLKTTYLLSLAYNLTRIAERIANIGEHVTFSTRGVFVEYHI